MIDQVIQYLKGKGFIDDRIFARTWIGSRLKKPLGLNRLKAELKQKGICEQIISQVLSEAKEGYNEDELVQKLAQQKFAKLRDVEPYKAKRRLYSYFIRRGFSADVVTEIISQL